MTNNTTECKTTLQEYNQEVQPNLRALFKKQEILKEWQKDDKIIAEYKQQIVDMNDNIKSYTEEKEAELTREINDLKTDIKLAIKAAAKASGYKPAELTAFFTARAKEAVEKTLEKAELFNKLNEEIA